MKNAYMTPTERINQLARELLTAMTEQQEMQSRADKLAYQYGEVGLRCGNPALQPSRAIC